MGIIKKTISFENISILKPLDLGEKFKIDSENMEITCGLNEDEKGYNFVDKRFNVFPILETGSNLIKLSDSSKKMNVIVKEWVID